jgi:GT2 family glycosyltransferase
LQTWAPERVAVWDTGIDAGRLAEVASRFPEVSFLGGENRGYAGGANGVVQALNESAPPEFVLVLNPDVVLDTSFAQQWVGATAAEPNFAIATGKLLRSDRKTIDSAGTFFPRHRRPRDRGSEDADRGQYDRAERVEVASGAAMLVRSSAIEVLSIEGELFDEPFFAAAAPCTTSVSPPRFVSASS